MLPVLDELCYQYTYDQRNRLVVKQIPGKGKQYIVYDVPDRPVLTQDAVQAGSGWLFTKYDVFGRVAYTGIFSSGSARISLQATFNNKSAAQNYEEKVSSGTGYSGTHYTNADFPDTSIEVLTANYYDDYTFEKATLSLPSTSEGEPIINYNDQNRSLTKGLPTGSRVKVLETSNWTTTLTGYDVKGRSIYMASNNTYLGTIDKVSSKLDFTGNVDKMTAVHEKTNKSPITTVETFAYDHVGRVTKQTHRINSGSTEVIAQNNYDALGQLGSKKIGNVVGRQLQTVDYSYNIRGWLKEINDVSSLGTDLFGFEIRYNDIADTTKRLFNGNISQTNWSSASSNSPNDNPISSSYTYTYDALNRITSGKNTLNSNYDLTNVGYDKNGNITALSRRGHLAENPIMFYQFGVMDDLVYTYSGNQLKKVVDNGNDIYGFKDGADIPTEYIYDSNGNMKTDANKGITSITYNHLNLPKKVTLSSGNIEYIHDATGVKLQKIVSTGLTTSYAGNYIYEGDSLRFFNHAEGYIDASGSGYKYVYQYKDHLGNIRLSYKNIGAPNNPNLEILEENNYYPFGLEHKGYNNVVSSTNPAQNYKYNGKELNKELGLDWYDYGARNYDASLGRWMNIDPLAENSRRWTPYNYAYNNPMFFVDPDGMQSFSTDVLKNDDGTYTVKGGNLNDNDKGIYVVNENGERTGEKIGESATMYSFYNDDKQDDVSQQGWKGTIDPNSTEGADFLNNLKGNEPGLLSYMWNATSGEKYDLKRLDENGNPLSEDNAKYDDRNYHHRGSVFGTNSDGSKVYGSARDFGNYAAGYIAGANNIGWGMARVGFNGLEQLTSASSEGQQSVRAQKLGHNEGAPIGASRAAARKEAMEQLKLSNPEIFYPRNKL